MNKIHARRLLALCDLLETDRVKNHFNFRYWVVEDYAGAANLSCGTLSCGTTACALGWATTIPALRDKRRVGLRLVRAACDGGLAEVVIADGGKKPSPEQRYNNWRHAAHVAFGLNRNGQEVCFMPLESRDDEYTKLFPGDTIPNNYSTSTDVAAHIRKFVAYATSKEGKAAGF